MERCLGTTKAGARCKRSVREGARYCAAHVAQGEATSSPDPTGEAVRDKNPIDRLIALAIAGLAVGAALTFRKLFRFS